MNDQHLATLVRRYQQHLAHTGSALGATARQAWDDLGSWDEADIATFTAQLEPAATAALEHATSLAAGFVALAKSLDVPSTDPPAPLDWSPAFFAYWNALTNNPADAFQLGRNRIEALGFDGVQSAARQTTTQIDRNEPRLTRWARVPDGGACDWCIEVAGDDFHSAESADFGHLRCGCAVVPA